MGTVNPVVWYYDIVFLLSLAMAGLYMFKWQKHFDVHITLVFVLVTVINLGYALMAHATKLEELLAADKLTFVSGCFLELNILLVVCTMCKVRVNPFLKVLFFLLSSAVFISALTIGKTPEFYKSVDMEIVRGLPVLRKEYGWVHDYYHALILAYFLISLGVIVYTFVKKNQISRKILVMLILPEAVAMAAFYGGRRWIPGIELVPAAYLIAEGLYLAIVTRISLYDVVDTAIDSLVQNGDTGFISIDFGYHYLGSNETAKQIFPSLNNLTVDLSINRSRSFKEEMLPRLERYRADNSKKQSNYQKDDKIYMISISPLYNNRKEKGYQLTVTDNTRDQMYIRLMKNYSKDLEKEVEKKTAHIVDMHNNLILSMATMVESRDNSTGGHIRRTSKGVEILLGEMNRREIPALTDTFRKNLIKAAPMHDLGKIAVDDEILRKPGRFTPEEFEKMKAHAPEGARIVHEVLKDTDDDEFHEIAENVAHYHHERWDGSGYPEGLKGEEIPLEARIMAVADVYDALVSKRVYKEKMSFETADRIMMEGMGTQFAPEMKEVYERARPKLEQYYSDLEKEEETRAAQPG